MLKAKALEVPTSDLRPNPWNTNFCSPENEAKLEASVDRFAGLFKPILVRQVKDSTGYEILGGEHRWLIASRKRLKTVPIWNLGEIDDKIAKEISLADNARYGADDTLALSELLQGLGDSEELQSFLPYSDIDLREIFSSSDISLAELETEELPEDATKIEEPLAARAPKTHTMIRFKVPIEDAERLTKLIVQTQKKYGYTAEDQATNAGDALVHLLLNGGFDAASEE